MSEPVVVRSRVAEGVELIEMDNPSRYNSLTTAMVSELNDAFAELRSDRSVRAVIIAGRGKGFCAGANMTGDDVAPAEAQDRGPVGRIHFAQDNLARLMLAIHESPQPVIAAVHGAAVGGGLAIAISCDLRVASDDAYFGAQFIRVGLSACDVGSSYWLPRLVGPTIAAELMLSGRRFSAEEAMRFGMLNRLVARDALIDSAVELAQLVTANSEYGVYMTKLGMWAGLDAPSLRHAIELENRTQVLGTFTGNMTEAGRAFVEKRDPTWKPL
jgi:enoyl-CoA hydratase